MGIQAFNVGVTLDKASRVYMAELVWTPADALQAEDRAHRLNSQGVVDIIYLIV